MLPAPTLQTQSWKTRLGAVKNIPPVLKLVWRSGPGIVAASLALRISASLIPVGLLWIAKLLIDQVVAAIRHPGYISPSVWVLLACEFLLAVAGNICGRATDYCDARLSDAFAREASLRIMRHAGRLDLASFEDPVFSDKLERARVQATDRIGMVNAMGRLVQQAITLASLAAAIIIYSPALFALLVICVIPAFLGESHFAFLGYSLAHELTPVRRELEYLRELGTSKQTAKEVKVFGLGEHLCNRFDELATTVIEKNKRLLGRRLSWGSVLSLIGSLGYYVAYTLLVIRALRGQLSIGELTFLAGSLSGCTNQLAMLFSTFSGIADQALYLTDLLDFFAVKPRIRSRLGALPAPRPIRDGFEFRNVYFGYPGSSRLILKNLNFHIGAGERIALVGENGQGKTTFVKLLARLYDPISGSILLDGVDLRDYNLEDLRREIGVIFQDFVRYDLPVRENIGIGRIDLARDNESLHRAARKSRAIEVIEKLPDGLDQMLGRRFERGIDLSGGEWQKFALARAYLRDAQILILDEPTSSLDAAAELEVFRRFAELTEGRTSVLISHRFSTVRMSDRIVVLEDGKVREQGTHKELIARGDRYARLFEMQAASYR
jgi:ATP-binding cassette subfamily B protein